MSSAIYSLRFSECNYLIEVFDIGLSHEDELSQLRFAVKNGVENVIRHRFGSRFHVEFFGSIQYVEQSIVGTTSADYRYH